MRVRCSIGRFAATEACAEVVALANSRVVLDDPVEAPALSHGIADALEQVIARGAEDRVDAGRDLVAWRRTVLDRIADVESVTERCRSLLGQRDELRRAARRIFGEGGPAGTARESRCGGGLRTGPRRVVCRSVRPRRRERAGRPIPATDGSAR